MSNRTKNFLHRRGTVGFGFPEHSKMNAQRIYFTSIVQNSQFALSLLCIFTSERAHARLRACVKRRLREAVVRLPLCPYQESNPP